MALKLHTAASLWILSCAALLLQVTPALACKCESSFSACHEFANADLIFIGTVVSIDPPFLSRWAPETRSTLTALNAAYEDSKKHPSADSSVALKKAWEQALKGLSAEDMTQLGSVKTVPELISAFNLAMDRGVRVRFRVKTLYKQEDGDDDDGLKTEPDEEEFREINTPFGDCGFDFQPGETYVVYGINEEGTDKYFTSSCTRTRRVSDAGEDLAFLFFRKKLPEQSTRLEGFATTDVTAEFDFDKLHDPDTVRNPVAGLIVELQSDHTLLRTPTDTHGHFLFDGLKKGDYKLSAFEPGYPFHTKIISGPYTVHAEKQGCAQKFLIIPKARDTR